MKMGKNKLRYENNGRCKTTFTVNFENSNIILELITPLLDNSRIKGELLKLAIGIIGYANKDDTIEGGLEVVTKILQCLSPPAEKSADVSFFLKSFGSFFPELQISHQIILYKILGEQLNSALYEQSQGCPKMENIDISTLLGASGQELYDTADPRLTVFIEEAVKTLYTDKFGSDLAKTIVIILWRIF